MSTATLEHPVLTSADFADPLKFATMRHVPVLDAHDDDHKGDLDEKLLHLIAENTNRRIAAGNPTTLHLGHLLRKTTLIVMRPDGSRVILPGHDETAQPPLIGYASNCHVAPYQGKPTLHWDWHIFPDHTDKLREYPFRSAERLAPPEDGEDDGDDNTRHYVDRIALLKTPPQRPLGVTQYEADICVDGSCPGRPMFRITYAREFPPIEEEKPMAGAAMKPPPKTAPPADDTDQPPVDGSAACRSG